MIPFAIGFIATCVARRCFVGGPPARPVVGARRPGRRSARAPVLTTMQRRALTAGISVTALLAGMPPLVCVAIAFAGFVFRRRADRRTALAERVDEVELARLGELLAVGVRSGQPAMSVLAAVERRLVGAVGQALAAALERHRRGQPLTDAFDATVGTFGTSGARLAALIAASESGAGVADKLDEWAVGVRTARRHRVEADARRLPVRMLAPLLVCVLPAFLCLTVMPLVVDGLAVVIDGSAP